MKTLGMIGGVGPESTVEYYRTIISRYRTLRTDGSYPQFIINSIDLRREVDLITANDLTGATRYLVEEIEKLARAGATFGLIAANTPHIVFEEVQADAAIPLVSIVQATLQSVKALGFQRPALFGTRFTMGGTFYPKVFSRERIDLITPELSDQEYIHDKYMNELVEGTFLPETHAGLLQIVDRLKETRQIDAVILAGTELPLILREPAHHGVPFLDTMRVHAEAAVTMMLS